MRTLSVEMMLAAGDASASSHGLDSTSAQSLFRAHGVLMSRRTFNYIGTDFSIAMRMRTQNPCRPHEIIVHDAHYTKSRITWLIVLCEREIEARLQPIGTYP